MNTERGFLQAIAEEPDDDGLRLIFADFLEDQGRTAWAALIRRQIAARPADPDELDRGWSMDVMRFRASPTQDLAQIQAEMGYPVPLDNAILRRGFVEHLHLPAEQLLQVGAELAAWGPVPQIKPTGVDRHANALARWDPPAGLSRLNLSGTGLRDHHLEALIDSPLFVGLRELCLSQTNPPHNRLSAAVARILARAPSLHNLRRLDLHSNPIGDDGLRLLMLSKSLNGLTWLGLGSCRIQGRPFETLRDRNPWPHLRVLDLISNRLDVSYTAALASSPLLAQVRRLRCAYTGADDSFAFALSESAHVQHLRELDLEGNRMTVQGYQAILRSPYLSRLRHLDLPADTRTGAFVARGTMLAQSLARPAFAATIEHLNLKHLHLGDEGGIALTQRDLYPRLKKLGLGQCGLGQEGAQALLDWAIPNAVDVDVEPHSLGPAGVEFVVRLKCHRLSPGETTHLDLERMNLGDDGLDRLIEQPDLTRCCHLNLMQNNLSSVGIERLARCPSLANLERLNLGINPIGDEGVRALAASHHLARLQTLELGTCRLTDDAVQALATSQTLTEVQELVLFDNHLTDRSASFLAEWPHPALTKLHLTRSNFSSQGWGILLRRYGTDLMAY